MFKRGSCTENVVTGVNMMSIAFGRFDVFVRRNWVRRVPSTLHDCPVCQAKEQDAVGSQPSLHAELLAERRPSVRRKSAADPTRISRVGVLEYSAKPHSPQDVESSSTTARAGRSNYKLGQGTMSS